MKIYGGGLAGLLAGSIFQRATIFESGPEGNSQHKAVLRFRTSSVGDAVGIDFRRVRVHKGIWMDGRFVQPDIRLANLYSRKVIGRLADRSIWNLDPCDRFIAPEDFIGLLAERCNGRIVYDTPITAEDVLSDKNVAISTIPMNVMLNFVGWGDAPHTFNYAPIRVKRWRVKNADVFQTIYFPSPETNLYRASITGDLLIAEYVSNITAGPWDEFAPLTPFGLEADECEPIESVSQRYGKIAPIDDAWRKKTMFDLTTQHGIFSLGRFATWRNILMDDVLKDISVIKKLISASIYERGIHSSK